MFEKYVTVLYRRKEIISSPIEYQNFQIIELTSRSVLIVQYHHKGLPVKKGGGGGIVSSCDSVCDPEIC
jgi:hypothetical protein